MKNECVSLFQKKDANIKTIPAFKPIPSDNATPDTTPEKSSNVCTGFVIRPGTCTSIEWRFYLNQEKQVLKRS